jgi:hypothetical protein
MTGAARDWLSFWRSPSSGRLHELRLLTWLLRRLIEQLLPTLRKKREGWGTRASLVG